MLSHKDILPELKKAPKKKAQKKAIKKKAPKKAEPLYERIMWKGVKEIFKCSDCGHCEDYRDDIIPHVIKHVPNDQKADVLDRLVKEI